MTLLEDTRRLVLPPGSNAPLDADLSWASLLPGSGVVGIKGDVGPEVEAAVRRFCASTVRDANGGPSLSGLIVAPQAEQGWRNLIAENPSITLAALPGAAVGPMDRRWVLIDGQLVTRAVGNRLRRLVDLTLARLSSIGGFLPDRLRGHASDVGFIEIPDDCADSADPGRVSVGLASGLPPEYLSRLAAANGWPIDGDSWSFGPPRGFASQKIVFRLASAGRPFVVKMTQEPRFNARLEAEGSALERWAGGDETTAFVVADPLFSELQGGLRLIGQSLLEGRPVRMVADPDPHDAVLEAGFRAAVDLGVRSVGSTTTDERRDALDCLNRQFTAIYRPPPNVADELARMRERLAAISFPSVFMHGDFTLWNLLAQPDGRIAVLDWENADPRGLPLWDLFTYARTVGKFFADARGVRYTGPVFRHQFLEESPLRAVFDRWVGEYCDALGVPPEAAGDLFAMCWVQQAVREAATLARPAWDAAQSTTFLSVALEHRLAPDSHAR